MRTQIIHLAVPGEPQGKQRPRWSRVGTYTPPKTVSYETFIKELFAQKYPDFRPLEGALKIKLMAYLMIPASASKKKKVLMEANVMRPTRRPDIDNILKVTLDALQGLAFKNDSQVVSLSAYKQWSYTPRLEIQIYEI